MSLEEKYLESLKESWGVEQEALLDKLVIKNTEQWQKTRDFKLVGGLDLSFSKVDPSIAVCTLVICNVKEHLKVVYEDSVHVRLQVPYIPGYLAFREVKPCQYLYKKLLESHPNLEPQVVLFDGNGILHPRGLGLASHFGVLEDICTVGVAKNLYQMGSLLRDEEHKTKISNLKRKGDYFRLQYSVDQRVLGVALKTSTSAVRPVYVSVGHKVDLQSAIWVVLQSVTDFRIPEPTRQADIRSRKELAKRISEPHLAIFVNDSHQNS